MGGAKVRHDRHEGYILPVDRHHRTGQTEQYRRSTGGTQRGQIGFYQAINGMHFGKVSWDCVGPRGASTQAIWSRVHWLKLRVNGRMVTRCSKHRGHTETHGTIGSLDKVNGRSLSPKELARGATARGGLNRPPITSKGAISSTSNGSRLDSQPHRSHYPHE